VVVVIIAGSTAWSCTLHHWADHLRPPPLARYDAHPSPDGSNASSCIAQKDTRGSSSSEDAGRSSRGSSPHTVQAALSAIGSCNLLDWSWSLCSDVCTEGTGDAENTRGGLW
jgi:hypothetical protein